MAHQSESEMDSRAPSARATSPSMTASSFEHALDDLYGFSTQPPPVFGAIEEPWFEEPTRLLHANESTRLDAAALFEGLPIVAPSAAAEEIGLIADVADAARRRAAPTVHLRHAPPVSNGSRIVLIALAGALALVGLLAVWRHFHP